MNRFRLDSKVTVVTGAAGLLGKGFCHSIAEAGGVVIIADINEGGGKELEGIINDKYGKEVAYYCNADIVNISSINKMIKNVINKYSRIDALVNNAYPRNIRYGTKFEDVKYVDFCENMNLHLGGYFLVSQQISKVMMRIGAGNIVNISSIYGFAAPRFEIYEETEMTVPVEYAVIKAAIINLTKYLASYLGEYSIRVNCLSPGGVSDNQSHSFVKQYSKKVLIGNRIGNVSDYTGALIFLLSDDSKYLDGQNIVIDGGWTV